ncbi:NUDIX domain-containing protein [Roseococcus sp. YIM B11640]|uniref:NUDIX hydrolase n=1 Tax=Roseococcus sp. YIM B11640 TaxID=3133973 RepID=UPI003C7C1D0E
MYPANFSPQIPDGEDRTRQVCGQCGFIAYENPKIVVGSVIAQDGKVLLCRRAIEPRRGYWTLPAGYLELGETVEEGALREAWEEARAKLELDGILAIYSIARIGQVQIIYRARLAEPGFAAGPESLEVRFFAWGDIPWDEIAFPSARWALKAWSEGSPLIAGNPPQDARGTAGL